MAIIQCIMCGRALDVPEKASAVTCPCCATRQMATIRQECPTAQSLLQQGYAALKNGDWEAADDSFGRALTLDAQCAEAFLGLAMSKKAHASRDECAQAILAGKYDDNENFQRARQLAKGELRLWLDTLENRHQTQPAAQEPSSDAQKTFQARMKPLWKTLRQFTLISSYNFHTIGLRTDGTAVKAGGLKFFRNPCSVSHWRDIVSVAAGSVHVVGLKSDGTVVAVGKKTARQCDVSGWRDIVALTADSEHTIGVRLNGTVAFESGDEDVVVDLNHLHSVAAIAMWYHYAVILWTNGTVAATGDIKRSVKDGISGWRDIVSVAACSSYIVGLKSDGTVVTAGDNKRSQKYGQCDVSDWRDIVAVAASGAHTVGLKSDGTVVAVGANTCGQCNVSDWRNIVAVTTGGAYTIGVKSDGTVVAVGDNSCGQCDISDWKLFSGLDELEAWCAMAEGQRDRLRPLRIATLEREKNILQERLTHLRGPLFVTMRRNKLERQLAGVEAELKMLYSAY